MVLWLVFSQDKDTPHSPAHCAAAEVWSEACGESCLHACTHSKHRHTQSVLLRKSKVWCTSEMWNVSPTLKAIVGETCIVWLLSHWGGGVLLWAVCQMKCTFGSWRPQSKRNPQMLVERLCLQSEALMEIEINRPLRATHTKRSRAVIHYAWRL